jgi:hypothetical protein
VGAGGPQPGKRSAAARSCVWRRSRRRVSLGLSPAQISPQGAESSVIRHGGCAVRQELVTLPLVENLLPVQTSAFIDVSALQLVDQGGELSEQNCEPRWRTWIVT